MTIYVTTLPGIATLKLWICVSSIVYTLVVLSIVNLSSKHCWIVFRNLLLEPDFEAKIKSISVLTALLLGPIEVGNTIIGRPGILQMILVMANSEQHVQQVSSHGGNCVALKVSLLLLKLNYTNFSESCIRGYSCSSLQKGQSKRHNYRRN